MILINNSFNIVNILTFIGANMGILCMGALNAAKKISGLCGSLSSLCFIFTSWHAHNFLNLLTYIIYLGILYLPIMIGKRWKNKSKIKSFTFHQWILIFIIAFIIYLISGYLISLSHLDPHPWIDAFTLSAGICGAVLSYLRYRSQYFWWLILDISNVILWIISFYQGNATLSLAVQNFLYIISDCIAFYDSPWFNHSCEKSI